MNDVFTLADEDISAEIVLDYVFVYGTLRSGCRTGAHQQYLSGASFISPAKIRGQLFMVDYYPGLVLSHTDDDWVLGEIYLLQSAAQLHQLDVYEGCAPKSPQPHEYERKRVDVHLSNNELMQVWTYVYKQSTESFTFIPSGDFLQRHELLNDE